MTCLMMHSTNYLRFDKNTMGFKGLVDGNCYLYERVVRNVMLGDDDIICFI